MLVKIEARILMFPGTGFLFPSTSVPPDTFFRLWKQAAAANVAMYRCRRAARTIHSLALQPSIASSSPAVRVTSHSWEYRYAGTTVALVVRTVD